MPILIRLKPKKVLIFLLSICFVLYLTDLFLTYLGYRYHLWYSVENYENFHDLFSTMRETSIPTLFSTLNLLFSSILLWVIAKRDEENIEGKRKYWMILSIIFFYLVVDEGAAIHEFIGRLISSYFDFPPGHPFYYSWVIAFSILVVIFAIIYLKFILTLPRQIGIGIFAAGSLELGRQDGSRYRQMYNFNTVYMAGTLQELLEMVAISVFNYVLLKYLALKETKIELSVRSDS